MGETFSRRVLGLSGELIFSFDLFDSVGSSLVFFQGSVFVFSFTLLNRTFKTAISNLTEFYHSFAYNIKDLLIYSLHRK